MSAQAIARLKITLDYVEPLVMRRIEVPADIRLDRLHLALQAAMGWETYHLWEFHVRARRFGPPGQDFGFGDGPLNAEKATLQTVIEDCRRQDFEVSLRFRRWLGAHHQG